MNISSFAQIQGAPLRLESTIPTKTKVVAVPTVEPKRSIAIKIEPVLENPHANEDLPDRDGEKDSVKS